MGPVDEDREGQDFPTPCRVRDDKLDVVGALNEGKVVQVVRTGLKPQGAGDPAVDIGLYGRFAIQRERPPASGRNVALRIQQAVCPLDADASHVLHALESARLGKQITSDPPLHSAHVVIDQPGAVARELAISGTPVTFVLQDNTAKAGRPVHSDDGVGKSRVLALMDIVGAAAQIHVGGIGRRLGELAID